MRLDVGHPGIFGVLHLTDSVLGHTKSYYGTHGIRHSTFLSVVVLIGSGRVRLSCTGFRLLI